ncbi:16S rRNA (cytidine(1402)-2'-O)-methyltransferase [candidate division KSB1 bacterium]|nr:16S rRNA (cytidine(1402)-2'-O)-methyltransferase [candidate division KSB1 bacterium]
MVSTPIGNLKDITFRAIDTLSNVNLIAAEDTRRTQILLNHYQIKTQTTSYHEYNKIQKTPLLIEKLKTGASIALVSDAGTPGISDPCFFLLQEAIKESIPISVIPGPTAFVPALLLAGLPLHRFAFEGFLPLKKGRQTRLKELSQEPRTLIIYEAPHRLKRTLNDLLAILGNRNVALCKELTKIHEMTLRGDLTTILQKLPEISIKGEWVIVVEGAARNK